MQHDTILKDHIEINLSNTLFRETSCSKISERTKE